MNFSAYLICLVSMLSLVACVTNAVTPPSKTPAESACDERMLAETLDPKDAVLTGEMAHAVAAVLAFRRTEDHPVLSQSEQRLEHFRIVVNLKDELLEPDQIGLSFTPRTMEPPVPTDSWRGFVYTIQKPDYRVVKYWKEE